MPDTPASETEVSQNTSGPVISVEKTSTEVLDANGKNISGGTSALGSIFDKIADGTDAKTAVREVMKRNSTIVTSEPEKKVEPETPDAGNTKPDDIEEKPAIVVEKTSAPKEEKVVKQEDKTEDKSDEVSDADLQVLPYDKPKTARRISTLLEKITKADAVVAETKKQAEEKAKRLSELEEQLKAVQSVDPMTNEKVKEQLDELSMYRRRYELENSPEVRQKFDGRVESAEQEITNTLLKHRLPESVANEIKSEGGWLKFVDSGREIQLANGKVMTGAELAEAIKANLPQSERRKLEALELEQIQTARDKQNYFNEESKKAKEYFANKENLTKQQAEQNKKAFEEASKVVVEWRKKFSEENEWLKEKEISSGATPEQKAALEDHNKHAKQLNSLIEKHLAAKDINAMLEVLVDSVKYHQERRNLAFALDKNKKLEDQLKAKQDELDKFKRASSPVGKSGSIAISGNRPASESAAAKPPSLEDAFAALEAGKSLDS